CADERHVAPAVYGRVGGSVRGQLSARVFNGPALHKSGRIESTVRHGGEIAASDHLGIGTEFEHFGNVSMGSRQRDLTALQAADVAVVPVGAEHAVDLVQPADHIADRIVPISLVTDVN